MDEKEKEILIQRARALASPRSSQRKGAKKVLMLEVKLMGGRFAFPMAQVDGIQRITDIFPIPLVPKHILGVIRRLGKTLALASMRRFLHPNDEGLVDAAYAVIVSSSGKQFALQVEDIKGVTGLSDDELLPLPANFNETMRPYVRAVTGEGLKVLNLEELVAAKGFSTQRIDIGSRTSKVQDDADDDPQTRIER